MQQIGDDDEADGAVANLDNIWTDAFYQVLVTMLLLALARLTSGRTTW